MYLAWLSPHFSSLWFHRFFRLMPARPSQRVTSAPRYGAGAAGCQALASALIASQVRGCNALSDWVLKSDLLQR